MRLGPAGEAAVVLVPQGYQFPGAKGGQPRDWDANWLIIDGDVAAGDGSGWRFSDPCLTTWEAAGLGRWLRAVAGGTVAPVALDDERLVFDGSPPEGVLQFTEPTVAFSLAGRQLTEVTLRVHLSSSVRPGPDGVTRGRVDSVVTVQSTAADLIRAVEVWDGELAAFPAR